MLDGDAKGRRRTRIWAEPIVSVLIIITERFSSTDAAIVLFRSLDGFGEMVSAEWQYTIAVVDKMIWPFSAGYD